MSLIGKIVRSAHIVGAILIASLLMYNLNVKCEKPAEDEANRALMFIESQPSEGDEDDGIVTDEDETQELFVPTDEWTTVKKGQKIPAGLHVKMDFKTGEKQAKLMDDKKAKDKLSYTEKWDAGEKIGFINTEKQRFTRDELKQALKDFKYQDDTAEEKERKAQVKQNFRSYDELQKAMKDMNMAVKTEGEIVTDLTQRLKERKIETPHLKTILVDLEYYLHQIDNAQLFCDLDGMVTMMTLLNNTDDSIREAAAHTLGAAVQSNAKVQISALEAGVMQQLLRMLATDSSFMVKKRALFALSALLRQFPFSQKKFLQDGGLSAFSSLFKSTTDDNLRIKVVTLLTDILLEYDYNIKFVESEIPMRKEKALQYQQIKWREAVTDSDWCGLVATLLLSPSNHDSVEKAVNAMSALVDVCQAEFSPTKSRLQSLLSEYKQLAVEDDEKNEDDFYSSIHASIKLLVDKIHRLDL